MKLNITHLNPKIYKSEDCQSILLNFIHFLNTPHKKTQPKLSFLNIYRCISNLHLRLNIIL